MRKLSGDLLWLIASVIGTGFWVAISYRSFMYDQPSSWTLVLNAFVVVFLLSDYLAVKEVWRRRLSHISNARIP